MASLRDADGTIRLSGELLPVETFIQTVTYRDFVKQPGMGLSWEGLAPYMTIQPTQVVLSCFVFVTEEFDDTGTMGEIQVTNDPEGASTQLSYNAPDPKNVIVLDGVVKTTDPAYDASVKVPYQPLAPLTPVITTQGFNGDGSQGTCLIVTEIYTP